MGILHLCWKMQGVEMCLVNHLESTSRVPKWSNLLRHAVLATEMQFPYKLSGAPSLWTKTQQSAQSPARLLSCFSHRWFDSSLTDAAWICSFTLHSTVKTQKQLVSMGTALVLSLSSDFAFTLLACQPGCLSKHALTETTLSALSQAPCFWSLQPSEISPVTDEKGKLRNWLSWGPKSLNIWTKIQIQICLLNISPVCQSTIFLMKKKQNKTLFNNRRSAITGRFLEMNPADLISKIHKYQREVGKSQLGILSALYSLFTYAEKDLPHFL